MKINDFINKVQEEFNELNNKNVQKISDEQRHLNILARAVKYGYEIKYQESFDDNCIKAEEYLIDNTEYIQEPCKIEGKGSNQHLSWTDRMGFHVEEWGELPSELFVVDSLGKVFKLILE